MPESQKRPILQQTESPQHLNEMHPLVQLNQQLSRVNQWLAGSYEKALSILNQLQTGVMIIEKSGCVVFLNPMDRRRRQTVLDGD
jgi:hypothetical protein